MASLIIEGDKKLEGEIKIAGNKNAALPIIAASVLTNDECILENVPDILDVDVMLSLLQKLGKTIKRPQKSIVIVNGAITETTLDDADVRRLRASILYLGAVLARAGNVTMSPPGGCVIGKRGIGSHFDALISQGAQIETIGDKYSVNLTQYSAEKIFLREASVTATENVLFVAATQKSETIIENAASEPHIYDLATVLQKMGVKINGAGTNKIIVRGKKSLKGFKHKIISDHIEAGTFAILSASTGSDLIIRNVDRENLQMPCYFFERMGLDFKFGDDNILFLHPSRLKAPKQKIQVGLWPGFPTDLMSPMVVMATQADGVTLCHDWLYESRMFFIDKLIIMGAQITLCDPHRVLVTGSTQLRGQHLSTPDIRAGIALVIAALCAKGTSTIDKAELIKRGYENLVIRLSQIGASIRWKENSEDEKSK